jgi:hypothetical protein
VSDDGGLELWPEGVGARSTTAKKEGREGGRGEEEIDYYLPLYTIVEAGG